MRLIDADALLDRIPNLYERREVSRWVDKAKTVDAVEVVRCKDCIRYHPDDDVWGQCTVSGKMRRKDYCSYGISKDGDHHE